MIFLGVLGPGKGLWVCVWLVEEAVDCIFEFLDGSEYAALEAFLGELGEEALDGVEPGGRGRGEVEDEPRVLLEPSQDVGCLWAA
jgi:hypothetical protein